MRMGQEQKTASNWECLEYVQLLGEDEKKSNGFTDKDLGVRMGNYIQTSPLRVPQTLKVCPTEPLHAGEFLN